MRRARWVMKINGSIIFIMGKLYKYKQYESYNFFVGKHSIHKLDLEKRNNTEDHCFENVIVYQDIQFIL